jgi:hypothetical protein
VPKTPKSSAGLERNRVPLSAEITCRFQPKSGAGLLRFLQLARRWTLGGAATAGVRIIVWCKSCSHQTEPDPAAMAARYGAETPVLEWKERLVCSQCGSREVDMVLTGQRR